MDTGSQIFFTSQLFLCEDTGLKVSTNNTRKVQTKQNTNLKNAPGRHWQEVSNAKPYTPCKSHGIANYTSWTKHLQIKYL